jgi:hypothetical protein
MATTLPRGLNSLANLLIEMILASALLSLIFFFMRLGSFFSPSASA